MTGSLKAASGYAPTGGSPYPVAQPPSSLINKKLRVRKAITSMLHTVNNIKTPPGDINNDRPIAQNNTTSNFPTQMRPWGWKNIVTGTGGGPTLSPEPTLTKQSTDTTSFTTAGSSVALDPLQQLGEYNTSWIDRNPVLAEMYRYSPANSFNDPFYSIGRSVRNFLEDPNPTWYGRALNSGAIPGAGVTGLLGAGAGLLGAGIYNTFAKRRLPYRRAILAGLGLGAIGGGYAGHLRTKKAAVTGSQDLKEFIISKIMNDLSINMSDKSRLVGAVRNLSPSRTSTLASIVRQLSIGAVGAAVSSFLFGANPAGAVIGGLAAMTASSFFFPSNTSNTKGIPTSWL